MNNRVLVPVSLMLCIAILLCGFSFNNTNVAVDTEQNKVYRYIDVDHILAAFSEDTKLASKEYEDNYYLLSATIKEISPKGDSISVYGSDSETYMVCKCSDKSVKSDILEYAVGDSIALYGKLTVDLFDKEPHIQIEKIIKKPSSVKSNETYFMLNGEKFDATDTLERSLGNGRVKYIIPSSWSQIEVDIAENELGTIEGYQYVLNKMQGKSSADPEYVFITYFDKKLLKDASDIKKPEAVEKVIIENIEGQVGKFPSKQVSTYYSAKYKYYLGKYTDQLEKGKGYRTEYIFQEDADKGIVLLVYVYREKQYLSDVIFVSRFLKIASLE